MSVKRRKNLLTDRIYIHVTRVRKLAKTQMFIYLTPELLQVERSASASSLGDDVTTGDATLDSVTSSYTALDSTNPDRTPGDVTGFIDDSMTAELGHLLPAATDGRAVADKSITPPKPPRLGLTFNGHPGSTQFNTAHEIPEAEHPSFDITEEEAKLQQKVSNMASPDNYKLTFPGSDSMFEETQDFGDESYVRHSPDEQGHQVGYDPLLGHYSHGGRGYPHGSYISPSASSHEDIGADLPGVHGHGHTLSPSLRSLPDEPAQQHCDYHDNRCNSNHKTSNNLDHQKATLTTATVHDNHRPRHNGLSDVRKAAQQQALLGNDAQCTNQHNSFSDNEKDLLLPGNQRDNAPGSRRQLVHSNGAGSESQV